MPKVTKAMPKIYKTMHEIYAIVQKCVKCVPFM